MSLSSTSHSSLLTDQPQMTARERRRRRRSSDPLSKIAAQVSHARRRVAKDDLGRQQGIDRTGDDDSLLLSQGTYGRRSPAMLADPNRKRRVSDRTPLAMSRRTKTLLAPLGALLIAFVLLQLLGHVIYDGAPDWVYVIAFIWLALLALYLLALAVFSVVRFVKWAARDDP